MLWRKPPADIAKVGVEGSNPFARSKLPLGKSERYKKAAAGRPFAFPDMVSTTTERTPFVSWRRAPLHCGPRASIRVPCSTRTRDEPVANSNSGNGNLGRRLPSARAAAETVEKIPPTNCRRRNSRGMSCYSVAEEIMPGRADYLVVDAVPQNPSLRLEFPVFDH
jgi:hypothetical protein